ncbi:hypothetical protein BJV74DRAFT_770047 [Russula compacta]|nr:hypothetical protein BJV74DRAFT_770047 [Russula compacta]
MVFLSPTLLFLLSLPLLVFSITNSSKTDTNTCNPAHNGLASGSLQFTSDCNATTWCDNGVCRNRGCRRDEFPLGYDNGGGSGNGKSIAPPPKCSVDEFCPDEGSQCVSKISVGQPCQFDRDDSCQAPDDFEELRDTTGLGRNVNGSVCLNFVCQFANVTAGSQCEIENTGYVGYSSNGSFVYVVSRDNCKIGLYCDTNSTTCVQQKALGASCSADKECNSYNCLPTRICGVSPSNPRHFPMWVYITIGAGIFGGMIATLIFLFCVHRRQRDDEREKRLQYWREQNTFRQNILQMHETAQASLFLSRASSRRSFGATTEDSHAPILNYTDPPPSGQRQSIGEDGSYEGGYYNEDLATRTPYMYDIKI